MVLKKGLSFGNNSSETVEEKIARLNQEKLASEPTEKKVEPESSIEEAIEKKAKKEAPRLLKDKSVEIWQDMDYAITNIAPRYKKNQKVLIRELLEDSLKRNYGVDYKEFLTMFKKINH